MRKIVITDERHSRSVPVAHNGRITHIPVGKPFEASDEVLDALTSSSILFSVEDGDGSASGVAEPSPLDHDGDGRKGGSKRGAASTRAKGAAKKRSK